MEFNFLLLSPGMPFVIPVADGHEVFPVNSPPQEKIKSSPQPWYFQKSLL